MFRNIDEAIEWASDQKLELLESYDTLVDALDLASFNYAFTDFDDEFKIQDTGRLKKGIEEAEEVLKKYFMFIADWEENVYEIAKEIFLEEHADDEQEDFEKFLKTKEGINTLEIANQARQEQFDSDKDLQKANKMVGHRYTEETYEPHRVRRQQRDLEETIDQELKNFLEAIKEIPKNVILEAFDDY